MATYSNGSLTGDTLLKSLLTTSFGNLSLKGGASLLGFATGVILARLLGPTEFGRYVFVIASVNLAATAATLGLPALLTREVAKYQALASWGSLKGIIRSSHLIVASTIAAIWGIAATFAISGQMPELFTGWRLHFALALTGLLALNQIRAALLRGLNRVVLADVPDLLIRPLCMLLLAAAAWFQLHHVTATAALAFQALATGCAFAVGTYLLRSRTPSPVAASRSPSNITDWAVAIPTFLGIAVAVMLESQVGIYILGFLQNPRSVAIFQVANQLVGLVIMGLVSVNLPLQPRLASAWARDDNTMAQSLVSNAAKIGCLYAIACAVVLIPFAHYVVQIYGPGYHAAAAVMRILVVGQLVNAGFGPCGLVLSVTGHQRHVLYGLGLALVLNIALNLALVPRLSATGAAIAAVSGLTVWNLILSYFAWRLAKIRTPVTFSSVTR